MNKERIVFMGTPDFSVPILEGLIENYNVVGVVTQPDKEVGRKKELTFSPIKKLALDKNIPIFQPIKIKEDYMPILEWNPDIIITCAYGQIIPKALLDYPRLGCINVHASLLPKLRGGAPIHHAIIDGYSKTGVTIMYMDVKMDNGNIISQKETTITDEDTLESLHDRLSLMGKDLLLETLPSIIEGTNNSIPQEESEVTFGYNIQREEELVNFNRTTKEVFNHIRGLNPHPGAYALLDDSPIKLYGVHKGTNKSTPGKIISITKEGMEIATSDGSVIVTEVQFPGKKKMAVKDFINGCDVNLYVGKVFNK